MENENVEVVAEEVVVSPEETTVEATVEEVAPDAEVVAEEVA